MNETTLSYKNEDYTRSVEMIGDVEKIIWHKGDNTLEIFDQELCVELEDAYENFVFTTITPAVSII